jgi:hypothetical protein
MKSVARAVTVLVLAIVLTGPVLAAPGTGPSFALKAGYFFPSDEVFREVYGASLSFAADLTVPLTGPLHLWVGAELLSKTGLLPVSEEASRLRITPLFAGLRLQALKSGIRPYVAAAAAYFMFHEQNPIGEASDRAFGALAQAGLEVHLAGPVWMDAFAGYRTAKIGSGGEDPVEAKLDGFSAGLGLAYRF